MLPSRNCTSVSSTCSTQKTGVLKKLQPPEAPLDKMYLVYPPANEIYCKGQLSIFEEDGQVINIYFQNPAYLLNSFLGIFLVQVMHLAAL